LIWINGIVDFDSFVYCYNATIGMRKCMNEGMHEIGDSAKLIFEKSQINILQSPIKKASFLYCCAQWFDI